MDRDETARDIAYLIDEGRSYVETPKGITIHIPDSLPAAYKILAAIEPAIRADERARVGAEVERLRAALQDIANSDDIENALDPERNKRVARTALAEDKP